MSDADRLIDLARRLDLDLEAFSEAVQDATSHGEEPVERALRRGVVDSIQADILQTLSDPSGTLEGYEFESLLGRGAMGVVYKARQISLDRPVAIKTVLPGATTAASRFEAEAKVVAGFHHPNIVAAHELIRSRGRLYLVMELLDGETLGDRLKRQGPMPEPLVWSLVRQTASALTYAAKRNVVHRDVKPGNIFLVEEEPGNLTVKVTDFGLSALIQRDEERTQLTSEGKVIGTPIYMAPEQLRDSHVDHRADLYSVGATAYHMLSGVRPFSGDTLTAVLMSKSVDEPPRLSGVSEASASLVVDMLRNNPDDRMADFGELIRRIDSLFDVGSVGDSSMFGASTSEFYPSPPKGSDRTTAGLLARWVMMAALLLAAAGVFGWFTRSDRDAVNDPPAPRVVKTGRVESLFNGRSADGWFATSGTIVDAKDGENTTVLELSDTDVGRSLPMAPPFRVEIGIDLASGKSDSPSLTAWLGEADGPKGPHVVVSRTGAVVRKRPKGANDETTKGKDLWANAAEGIPSYRQLELERWKDRLVVKFAGEVIQSVPVDGPADTLRLRSDGVIFMNGARFLEIKESAE